MPVFMNNFKAIMWKNYIIRKRHWLMTIIEIIIIPFSLLCLLLYALFVFPPRAEPTDPYPEGKETTVVEEYSPFQLDMKCFSKFKSASIKLIISYSPPNSLTNIIMNKIKDELNEANIEFKSMNNEREIEDYYESIRSGKDEKSAEYRKIYFYGIVFESTEKILKYKIRIGRLEGIKILMGSVPPDKNNYYRDYCFSALQQRIDAIYIESVNNKNKTSTDLEYPDIFMNKFPNKIKKFSEDTEIYDKTNDVYFTSILSYIPFIIVFGFIISLLVSLKTIVEEKSTGAKELMKLMGLRNYMIWLGWLIHANMVNIIVFTISTILLTMKFAEVAMIPHTNPILMWFLLLLFTNAVTLYLFVICAIFNRSLVAIAVGLIFYLVPTFVFLIDNIQKFLNSKHLGLLPCLVPTKAMLEGFNIIFAFAKVGPGIQFNNIFQTPPYDENILPIGINRNLSFGVVMLMLLLDIIIYAIITWYIDNVRPGPYGRAKPWHFICTFCFKKGKGANIDKDINEQPNTIYFEKPPEGLRVGLFIRNLTKDFPPNLRAVNGINIDIYEGEITALLGHNGAGKTTTISIITGMFSPTFGTVYQTDTETDEPISIFQNMDKYRQNLGLCPQNNMLFSYFTVIEHLIFFGLLKGMSRKKAKEDGKELLNVLNMSEKENMKGHQLSGGMQRKLSLAISLIGSPKVLVLDEPTSGMDPESRRELWDILLGLREGRTIIITTHYMEEADALGDRIAIMDHGQVQCYGTPMFLKKAYGAGYNLILLTLPNANVDEITTFVIELVPGSELKSYREGQIVYILPYEQSSRFGEIFAELENAQSSMKITNIGVTSTTIEEVFLKVGDLNEIKKTKEINENTSPQVSLSSVTSLEKVTGFELCIAKFWFLLLKKIRFTYRTITSYIIFILIVLVMLVLCMPPSLNKKKDENPQNVKIDIDLHKGGEVLETNTQEVVKYATIYKSLITNSLVQLLPDKNIISEFKNIYGKDTEKSKKELVAADWKKDKVTGFYSIGSIHSLPISLNLITNTLLKSYNDSYSIVIFNHPLPEPLVGQCSFDQQINVYNSVIWAVLLPFGLLFVITYFIALPLHERGTGLKHLQRMTGVSPICYWLSSFIIDYFMFILALFIFIILILILTIYHRIPLFYSYELVLIFFFVTALYGVSIIAFAYFFTFLKKTSAGLAADFISFNLLYTIFVLISFSVISILRLRSLEPSDVLLIFMLNPFYCYIWIIYKFINYCHEKAMCHICHTEFRNSPSALKDVEKALQCDKILPILGFDMDLVFSPVIGFLVIILLFDIFMYTIIIILLDYGIIKKCFYFIKRIFIEKPDNEFENYELDDDVIDEFIKVDKVISDIYKDESDLQSYPVLIVDFLHKTYVRKHHAVRGVSFAVESGECFGLLGVNGAGKTTTFKMLVGEIIPSDGDAIINKYSLSSERSKYLQQIGYCPQFNALNDMMTARELIYLFGRLRGIRKDDCDHVTEYWLKYLGLDEYSDRYCGNYSGGNKRKLSTAIALVGNPEIVFLDEPTSGVDPAARRKLWGVLANCQKSGQSIVLTSHSMDECEALCNRLTIMVHGQMICIGNIEYLKIKFGQGFTIVVKLKFIEDANIEVLNSLKRDMETSFGSSCVLKDEHATMLQYHVADTSKTWSSLFNAMDRIKKNNESIVEDYTISETSLEEVFISFAKKSRT